jgi:hypothetical protein
LMGLTMQSWCGTEESRRGKHITGRMRMWWRGEREGRGLNHSSSQ